MARRCMVTCSCCGVYGATVLAANHGQISNLGLKEMKQGLSPRRWRTSTLSSMLFARCNLCNFAPMQCARQSRKTKSLFGDCWLPRGNPDRQIHLLWGMDGSALRINTQMLAVASCTRWRGLRPSVARVQILWPCVRTQGLQAAPRQRRRRWRHNDTETQIAKGIAKTQIAKVSVQNQFSVFFLYKHTLCGEKYIWYN